MNRENGTLLTVKEVSDRLRVSRGTVWKMIKDGRLHAFKVGKGRDRTPRSGGSPWRIPETELERLVEGD